MTAILATPSAEVIADGSTGVVRPVPGALIYYFQTGTTNPINSFTTSAATVARAHPVVADGNGRVPACFINEVSYRCRVLKPDGQVVFDLDALQGVYSPGDDGSDPDPASTIPTGTLIGGYRTDVIPGWVRAAGRTLGSATSGASEYAAADAFPLFVILWNEDATLTVSTGRGASAAADWAANKTIALPDFRGRAIVGRDSMGSTAAGILVSPASPDLVGASFGEEKHALTVSELAAHNHGVNDPTHVHPLAKVNILSGYGGGGATVGDSTSGNAFNSSGAATGISIQNTGSGTAHNNLQPSRLATIYLKL